MYNVFLAFATRASMQLPAQGADKRNTIPTSHWVLSQAAADQLLLGLAVSDCLKLRTAQSEGQILYQLNVLIPETRTV